MYINLAQFLIPKITSICSILINPFTVYIVWTDKKLQLGNYRYLVLYFAIFNMATSLMDMLVPMCVLIYHHAFSVFISDGLFSQHSEFNQILIAFRCSFISGARLYIRESMFEHHGQDILNMSIIVVQYFEGTDDAMFKSRFGILFLSILSFVSLALIFCFGYKICNKLSKQSADMSQKTKKLQTQLVKALIVQAAIPTCVSFAPCIISWYQPIFVLDFGC
ncbi:hypothetical protein L5515_006187 [Caenorhabditis briggsae]|uniref:G protein-coupled receptor n=1 Tax=Caenorhabditis briggsae TaxID=6238 RepID=A0AAE9JJN8_CAEBR|nr:hypothetical protein L5515_006187 [Caenorhabditis briggsae]